MKHLHTEMFLLERLFEGRGGTLEPWRRGFAENSEFLSVRCTQDPLERS